MSKTANLDALRKRMRDRLPKALSERSWYTISNQADKAVVRIYDEIWMFGVTAEDFARDLEEITAPEIEVQINSPGGDVFDGVAIYNALRSHSARITTRVDGIAASIASVIAQAGDHRVMLSGSQMMIHEAWGLVIGSAGDMREFADVLDRQDDVIAGIYAERSGSAKDGFRELMTSETWMTDQEAVDAGLADEVVTPPRREPQEAENKTLHDEVSEAVGAVSAVIDSAERVAALRAEQGKPLSNRNREGLDELGGHLERLRALLSTDDPEDGIVEQIRREHIRSLQHA